VFAAGPGRGEALRSMHDITRPPIGRSENEVVLLRAHLAAYSTWAGVPPNNCRRARALALADADLAWHPTSAPEMDALVFTIFRSDGRWPGPAGFYGTKSSIPGQG
jgi:hypothetical protein